VAVRELGELDAERLIRWIPFGSLRCRVNGTPEVYGSSLDLER
jgi:hypothetical protein